METEENSPSDSESGDLFARLQKQFRDDYAANADWYREAELDYAYEAGHGQWTASERNAMEESGRPCLTFNRIQAMISAIVGMEVSNRQEVSYLPRTTQDATAPAPSQPAMGATPPQPGLPPAVGAPIPGADDTGPAELLTGAALFFRDQCDAEDEESDMYRDAAISGVGCTETRVDYDRDPEGMIVVDRVDPLETVWDAGAKKRNLIDRRRTHRFREIDIGEARDMFPGVEDEELDAAWARSAMTPGVSHNSGDPRDSYKGDDDSARGDKRDKVMIVETEWYETVNEHEVVDPATGAPVTVSETDFQKLSKVAKAANVPLQSARRPRRVYKFAFMGASLLDTGDAQCQEGFKYNFVTGYRDRNKNQWYGVVRQLRDPQKWANVLASTVLNNIQTSGKGIIYEAGAFENPVKAEQDFAKANKMVEAAPSALSQNKIQPKPQANIPPGVMDMMTFSLQSMRDTTGVNVETLGLADRQQAASLEAQRRQSATTMLAPLFDGLRRYRKEQGRVMMHLIQEYCSDGRLIRIAGPEGQRYVELAKDPGETKFDIIVDDAPSSPNQKEATWGIIKEALPLLQKMPIPMESWRALLKQSPLPQSFVTEFFKPIENQGGQQGPSPEEQKIAAETQKVQAETALKQEELKVRQMEAASNHQLTMAKFADAESQRAHDEKIKGAELVAAQAAPAQAQGNADIAALAQSIQQLAMVLAGQQGMTRQ